MSHSHLLTIVLERSDAIMDFVRVFVPVGVEDEDVAHFHSTLVDDEVSARMLGLLDC